MQEQTQQQQSLMSEEEENVSQQSQPVRRDAQNVKPPWKDTHVLDALVQHHEW